MAMLSFNPPIFTTQPPSHDRNALIPAVPIPSVGGRLVFPPPRPLSLASRRGRDSHVPNIFRDLLRRGNASGSPEVSRIHEDDVEVVDSDYDDDDVGGDEDEDEIGDDVFVFGLGSRMQKWFENKPSGFGEGKVYDTSIEDKLLEEMRQSRIAQAANINKLKHSGGNGGDKVAGKKLKKKKNEVAVEGEGSCCALFVAFGSEGHAASSPEIARCCGFSMGC
ncbi:hypothetical protein MLD38_008529 [Melastoma candidum]|uniref:Uncharacterized protein n=1 Tax=Melastoma candidum TaxID=119954 RepID=A0ACB9RXP7_9MYRT|nr:hypothetical protein MLD38_008529 [Melastoma candidum]